MSRTYRSKVPFLRRRCHGLRKPHTYQAKRLMYRLLDYLEEVPYNIRIKGLLKPKTLPTKWDDIHVRTICGRDD